MLAELRLQYHLRPRETISTDSDGSVHITKTMNADPIMSAMLEFGELINSNRNSLGKMIGSIDPITAANWAKETGLAIGTREFTQFASKRIKDDRDYRNFKVGH